MSILTSVEAVPNRMRDIFTYVYQNKTNVDKGELRQIFMPPSKRSNKDSILFDNSIKECISIGLLVDNNGSIETSEFVRPKARF